MVFSTNEAETTGYSHEKKKKRKKEEKMSLDIYLIPYTKN